MHPPILLTPEAQQKRTFLQSLKDNPQPLCDSSDTFAKMFDDQKEAQGLNLINTNSRIVGTGGVERYKKSDPLDQLLKLKQKGADHTRKYTNYVSFERSFSEDGRVPHSLVTQSQMNLPQALR